MRPARGPTRESRAVTSTVALARPAPPRKGAPVTRPVRGLIWDTLVVTKLDRLARSVRDAHDTADDLAELENRLIIDGTVTMLPAPPESSCSRLWQ